MYEKKEKISSHSGSVLKSFSVAKRKKRHESWRALLKYGGLKA